MWNIIPIEPALKRRLDRFNCGATPSDQEVSSFLNEVAYEHHYHKVSFTYVALAKDDDGSDDAIIGYFTLYAGTLRMPRTFTKTFGGRPANVPAIVIGHIALHETHQHKGLGIDLLADALIRAEGASCIIGAPIVALHSYKKPSQWYLNRGFEYASANPWKESDENALSVEPMYLPFNRL